jgi:hypothetical protein
VQLKSIPSCPLLWCNRLFQKTFRHWREQQLMENGRGNWFNFDNFKELAKILPNEELE